MDGDGDADVLSAADVLSGSDSITWHRYGDGPGNACDNCVSVFNPDQMDHDDDSHGDLCDDDDDGDGAPDVDDCAPIDPMVSQPAGEPTHLGWAETGTPTMTWQNGPDSTSSNVYRGSAGMGFSADWDCLDGSVLGTSYEDADDPGAGAGYRYIVTGENVCGESMGGTDSEGNDREPDPCP